VARFEQFHSTECVPPGILPVEFLFPIWFAGTDWQKSATRLIIVRPLMRSYRRPCRFKLVGDNFELNDWRGCFLDANTPRPGLLDLIREKHPDGVTLLLTAYFNLESLLPTAGILPAVACGIPAARPKSKEHP
jgi:hypothetical protein